jgi:hypothetical protein
MLLLVTTKAKHCYALINVLTIYILLSSLGCSFLSSLTSTCTTFFSLIAYFSSSSPISLYIIQTINFLKYFYIYPSHLLGWSVVLALTVVVIFAVVFVLVDWILTRQKRRHQYRCRYLLQKDQEYSSATCLQERQHRRNQIRTLLM